VFGVGVALRLLLFSGYGLGDDPNYFVSYHNIYRSGTYSPADPYALRFGIWVPVVLFMKLLGVTEVGFIGAITLCSIISLALVYLLARQEWERPYALLAMALFAVYPLDVLCSTLFANDIVLATYCFAAFYLYRRSLLGGERRTVRRACAAASAVLLLCAFVTKPWAALMVPLFAWEAIRHWRHGWRYSLVTAGGATLLVGGYLAWQWLRFNDPLYHISVSRPVAIFLPYSRDILLDYPRMLFLPNVYGSRFAGYHPHLLVLLLLAFGALRGGKWLVFSALILLGLAAMPSHRQNGQWVTLVPHIFRYLCLFSIPLCLALAAYLRELFLWQRVAASVVTAVFLVASVFASVALTEPTRDAFGEERRAIAALRQFPDERVWSDWDFIGRVQNFELKRSHLERTGWFRGETAAKRAAEFAAVDEGMVVTGGGRLPWYGCFPCIPDLAGFTPPASWTLLTTFEGRPLRQYRHEPLRIWRVSRAAIRAKELLAERTRTDPGGLRLLLRELGREADHDLTAEVGRQLLAASPDDVEITYLTGMACSRARKPGCARRLLEQALTHGLDGPAAREAIVFLTLSRAQQLDFEGAARWVAEFRRRFGQQPLDPQLEEIESGMSEAVARYHEQSFATALRLFTEIAHRPDMNPERRKRAAYFTALTLFRMARVREAVERAAAYRSTYGEDGSWVELRYREGEALQVTDPQAARAAFADVVANHRDTTWAKEAERQLATVGDGSRR
jgi:hypothetical protein